MTPSSSSQVCMLGELSRRGSILSRTSSASKRSRLSHTSAQNKNTSDLVNGARAVRTSEWLCGGGSIHSGIANSKGGVAEEKVGGAAALSSGEY
ncbi:unnamed protein product [Toxocara canis]|uniref:Uncharacterized protein n=1 Tax=Toxocara canis TaxID=6265 RepID=A0A3P7H4I2_TOXCA|nr:unnamed protein product [Toxocara canis]